MSDSGRSAVEETPDATAPPERPQTASEAALARYGASMRRSRGIYFGVVGAIVVVLIVVVAVAWSRGEAANTTLHTVAKGPATLRPGTPAQNPQQAWRTGDRVALGTPLWGGTVVVSSQHTVRGLNARTGEQTWSYSRSNRTVCAAAQASGTTIAVYQVNGNCDELTALDSQTGQRRWTRTLAFDGRPLNGRPGYQVVPYTFMITSSSVIYAIDPATGYNRWTYTRYGCSIRNAVLGTEGAVISQTCTNPVCATQKFCGRGPQLLLRDGSNDRDDKSTTNPDRIRWNQIGDTDVPVSADSLVSALNTTTRALDVLDPKKGSSLGTVQLSPTPSAVDRIAAIATDSSEIVWIGDVAYAVTSGRDAPDWAARTSSPPTVVAAKGEDPPSLRTARITVPTSNGARVLNGANGATSRTISLPAPPSGSSVYPLGTGVLASSTAGTVAYS